MHNNIKKILITARDPASANDIQEVVLNLIKHKNIFIKIIAQDVAYDFFFKKTRSHSINSFHLIEFIKSNDEALAIKFIKDIVNEFRPNCLLTGISGPDYGIDELALDVCLDINSIRTFSIQSAWGDLNRFSNRYAETIFVLDEFASKKTRERCDKCRMVITGPMKYDKYKELDVIDERLMFRSKYSFSNHSLVISVFGQPLTDNSFYTETMSIFLDELKKISTEVCIVYKPHPKEDKSFSKWFKKYSEKLKLKCLIVYDNPFNILCGSNVSVSIFSSVLYDLQNILHYSNSPFSIPVYLFFNKDCKQWYVQRTKLREIPMSKEGMSILISNVSELREKLFMATSGKHNKISLRAIKNNFPKITKSPSLIVSEEIMDYNTPTN